jgi:hypothetical protein
VEKVSYSQKQFLVRAEFENTTSGRMPNVSNSLFSGKSISCCNPVIARQLNLHPSRKFDTKFLVSRWVREKTLFDTLALKSLLWNF